MFFPLEGKKRRLAGLAVAGALIAATTGCGDQTTQSNLGPDQVVQKAVPALQGANSFHFNLATSKLSKPVPGLFVTTADGDVVRPDKLSGTVGATYSGLPINLKIVVAGSSQYMTDPASGKWEAMPAELNISQYFDPNGVSQIISDVQSLKSDGTESVNGADSYRITGAVPATSLKKLSPEVDATGSLSTTLWIGSQDFLLRRVQLTGPFFQGEPADIVRTINMSDYNKQVTISTPVVK